MADLSDATSDPAGMGTTVREQPLERVLALDLDQIYNAPHAPLLTALAGDQVVKGRAAYR
jgi:hypothetical protein